LKIKSCSAITNIQDAFKQDKTVILNARKFDLSSDQISEIIRRVTGSFGGKLKGTVEIWTQSGQYKF
jgi:hypothetical protein